MILCTLYISSRVNRVFLVCVFMFQLEIFLSITYHFNILYKLVLYMEDQILCA